MYLLNGIKININRPYNSTVKSYPHLLPQEWRDELGVTEAPDPTLPDPEKFTWLENTDGTLAVTAIPFPQIKKRRLRGFRDQMRALFDEAYDLLDVTLVLSGQAATGPTTKMKADIKALTDAFATARTAVNAATTADEVLAANIVLPVI